MNVLVSARVNVPTVPIGLIENETPLISPLITIWSLGHLDYHYEMKTQGCCEAPSETWIPPMRFRDGDFSFALFLLFLYRLLWSLLYWLLYFELQYGDGRPFIPVADPGAFYATKTR